MNKNKKIAARGEQLPYEIFDSVVRSLHSEKRALLIGKIFTWIAIGIIWHKTQNSIFLYVLGLLILVGSLRLVSIANFQKIAHKKLSAAALRKYENIYALWGVAYFAILGTVCIISMMVTNDGTTHLIIFCTTLANIFGISGRNFGSAKIVNGQVLAVSIPIMLALILFGGNYHKLLASLLIPFLLALHLIAYRHRQMLFEAVFTAIENKTIANRFEIAMKNASHGMAMLDRNGKFLVANQRFNELYGIVSGSKILGLKLKDMAAKEMTGRTAMLGHVSLTNRLEDCMKKDQRQRFTYKRLDGITLEASFNPMTQGAGVLVLEDISERISSENEIRQLANFDPLTHLANRRYFKTQIAEQVGENPKFNQYSMFFLDLDKFKDINDTLGHAVGDKLLCAVSLRMKSTIPEDGMICRFGGDEFVIILPSVSDKKQCEDLALRLIEEVSKPILIDGNLIIVATSLGIALCPEDGNDFDQLLKMADVALYKAKTNGRGTFFFYTNELGKQTQDRRQMEVDLRRALENKELDVHYQPLIDLKNNKITGCEALVRWSHPSKGNISPAFFIPIAEEIGLISKIGKFVLDKATRECTKWPNDIRVAVNVSSLQFKQSDVCSVVTTSLMESGLNPNRLEIEVTESAAIEDLEETSRVLRSLAQGGVRISLDDFGTGFSSLSYLHQLPLDKVKIDRSFVETIRNDERSLILLSGVTQMAANLGLQIIVEGVEEIEQLDILRNEVHLDQVQGFLFGKPMPPEDIFKLIERTHAEGGLGAKFAASA